MVESPYPELKTSHTMARSGRPWTDRKPAPSGPVWDVIQGYGSYWMLVTALELGLFDVLRRCEPAAKEDIAAQVEAAPFHVGALLDAMLVLGFLDCVRGQFSLNDTARRYLLSDGPASMVELVTVAPGPRANWERLAATVRRGRPDVPIDDDPAAFYVPLVRATFATQLRVATRADLSMAYSRLDAPRLLELGAGGAPWSVAVLSACARASAVVNDLPGVIDVAAELLAAHALTDRVELRPGDFHVLDLEDRGYDFVVLGHVCRSEGPEGARDLIARAFRALAPEGRLALADYFADNDRKHNRFGVLMAATMAASTRRGTTFTHGQVHGWLRGAGFEAIRLIEPVAFNQVYVASRPREDQ